MIRLQEYAVEELRNNMPQDFGSFAGRSPVSIQGRLPLV
jgi:hypothetical protein